MKHRIKTISTGVVLSLVLTSAIAAPAARQLINPTPITIAAAVADSQQTQPREVSYTPAANAFQLPYIKDDNLMLSGVPIPMTYVGMAIMAIMFAVLGPLSLRLGGNNIIPNLPNIPNNPAVPNNPGTPNDPAVPSNPDDPSVPSVPDNRTDVLVVGRDTTDTAYTDAGADLVANMQAAGYSAVRSYEMPADLSQFEQIWYVGSNQPSSSEEDQIVQFIRTGGQAYLAGESRPGGPGDCCTTTSSTIRIINRTIKNPGVSYGGQLYKDYVTFANTGYGDYLRTHPNTVTEVKTAGMGYLNGVNPNNVVAYGDSPEQAVISAWGEEDVVGNGRIVTVGDLGWFSTHFRGPQWVQFMENITYFLDE